MTTGFSETGHRYQLIVRGECGPPTEWLSGDAAIETGHDCTSLIFAARDDSELYGLPDPIQDPGLRLTTLCEAGSTEAVPPLPGAGQSCPSGGFPLRRPRDPITPPWGPAVLPRAARPYLPHVGRGRPTCTRTATGFP